MGSLADTRKKCVTPHLYRTAAADNRSPRVQDTSAVGDISKGTTAENWDLLAQRSSIILFHLTFAAATKPFLSHWPIEEIVLLVAAPVPLSASQQLLICQINPCPVHLCANDENHCPNIDISWNGFTPCLCLTRLGFPNATSTNIDSRRPNPSTSCLVSQL